MRRVAAFALTLAMSLVWLIPTVTPAERRRARRAVGERDGDLLVAFDRVCGGDDDAVAPDDTARRKAMARVDGDDGPAGPRDGCRKGVRDCID